MCFTPIVSLATAATEFSVSGYLLNLVRSKRKLYPIPAFVFLLGLYQFTEFMLCTTESIDVWARIGFATYTFLPCLLLHIFYNLSGKHFYKAAYFVPIFFASLALLYPNFILGGGCTLLHVSVQSLIFNKSTMLMALYLVYYICYPFYGFYLYTNTIRKRLHTERIPLVLRCAIAIFPLAIAIGEIYFLLAPIVNIDPTTAWVSTSILITLVTLCIFSLAAISIVRSSQFFIWSLQFVLASVTTTIVILYVYFPQFAYEYSSIFCQFALLYAFASILVTKYELNTKQRNISTRT